MTFVEIMKTDGSLIEMTLCAEGVTPKDEIARWPDELKAQLEMIDGAYVYRIVDAFQPRPEVVLLPAVAETSGVAAQLAVSEAEKAALAQRLQVLETQMATLMKTVSA